MTPKIIPDKSSQDRNYTGLTFDIEVYYPDDKKIAETEIALTKDLISFMIPRLKKEVPELISYTDFYGEAEDFLRESNQSWTLRKDVAKTMYTNFLTALEESAYYDESEKCIYIKKKYLTSFDQGDYYSPAYEIIKKLLEKWLVEGEKTTNQAKKHIN
jgi:hypothetical protein